MNENLIVIGYVRVNIFHMVYKDANIIHVSHLKVLDRTYATKLYNELL